MLARMGSISLGRTSYPLIGVGEGQNFGLSYTQLMTMDLLQYDVSVTEILHTTCSKHVVVDGKGLVSMRPSHVYFWMCMKHRFQKNTKINDNL